MKSRKTTSVQEFDSARVKPFAAQPRKRFRGIKELAKSIAAVGQIIPGKVILAPADSSRWDAQLIDGERRLMACKLAGVPFRAEVREEAGSEADQFETSLAANFGKQDHDCIEIANALGRLQDAGRTLAEMADICGGKSTTWVAQHLSLLKLHPDIQQMLLPLADDEPEGRKILAFTTACMLANLPHDAQMKLAKKILNMSMVQARRVVLKWGAVKGIKVGKNTTSPADIFNSLESVVHHLTHRLGVFIDMDGRALSAAILSGHISHRENLADAINDLNDTLSTIGDLVDQSITASFKASQKKAG